MPRIQTMSTRDAAQYLRERGLSTSAETIQSGLKQGVFPFGDCVTTEAGGRVYYIYKQLLDEWISQRASGDGDGN